MGLPKALATFGIPALVAGMLVSCRNDLDRVSAVEVPQASPDRITTGAEYLYSDSGRVVNRLRAGRIAEWSGPEKRTELSDGVELVFFDSTGAQASTLTARRGTILPQSERMEVHQEVVFTNSKGERLETEYLIWYQDSARVYTDRPVRVVRGPDVIHGVGLEAAQDFSRYTVRRITGILEVAAGDTLAPGSR